MLYQHAPIKPEHICPQNDEGSFCPRWFWYVLSILHYLTLVFTTVVTWRTALQLTVVYAGS